MIKIMLGALGAVILLLIGVIVLLVLRKPPAPVPAAPASETVGGAAGDPHGAAPSPESGGGAHAPAPPPKSGGHGGGAAASPGPLFIPVDPTITVSIPMGARTKTLQAKMQIMIVDPATAESLKRHMPIIQNALMLLLSSKTYDELVTLEGKELLITESLMAVRNVVKKEVKSSDVEAVLFSSFILQ